ncbi:hypothetical protein L6E12_20695 [Actinokineospora sp. PR83]|uniref:hypothetical protein n=1 Tax=Actinokineospora sp. PR83 TaxID=2884908 RepID=UPI001F33D740|nr:hypothetical protein [Actinokineospora sp. PR83]MCG8918206.1 hypothetical protein [Actinokineospora sp. PR83]
MRQRKFGRRKGVLAVLAAVAVGASLIVASGSAGAGQAAPAAAPKAFTALGSNGQPLAKEVSSPTKVLGVKTAADGTKTTTVKIGPISLAPMPEDGDDHEHPGTAGDVGTMHGPNDPGGHHGAMTRSMAIMLPPCNNCYIRGIKPDMKFPDGSNANYDSDVMLHHTVFFDRSRSDVTCPGGWPGMAGRRIFASGNERTGGTLPDGYGVKLGFLPLTYMMIELMSMSHQQKEVIITVDLETVPDNTPGMKEATPVWLDADNCGLSEHAVPEGPSTTTWDWTSTIKGTFVGAGGHQHDGGESITLSNATTGQQICTSTAGYDNDPSYLGHIDTMSKCLGQDLGRVEKGETLHLDSVYHTHMADEHAMSIMVAFVDEKA